MYNYPDIGLLHVLHILYVLPLGQFSRKFVCITMFIIIIQYYKIYNMYNYTDIGLLQIFHILYTLWQFLTFYFWLTITLHKQ